MVTESNENIRETVREGYTKIAKGSSGCCCGTSSPGKLTFTRTSRFGDREFRLTFEGTVEGDNIKGVFRSERGEREANATRVTSAKAEEKKP